LQKKKLQNVEKGCLNVEDLLNSKALKIRHVLESRPQWSGAFGVA
jgi:hypothetical protein